MAVFSSRHGLALLLLCATLVIMVSVIVADGPNYDDACQYPDYRRRRANNCGSCEDGESWPWYQEDQCMEKERQANEERGS